MVLRVARGLAVELAKTTDIVKRNRRLSQRFIVGIDGLDIREMQHGPQQHRGMAIRQYETIAVRPNRILWIEAENPIPNRIDERRECHGSAGMSGVGLLHSVHRKRANGIDTQLIELCG